MDSKPNGDHLKAARKDTDTLRAILEILLFFVLIPTVMFGYPSEMYPSIVDWWNTGQAQLSVDYAEAYVTRFYADGDDMVSNLMSDGTLLIVKNTIPVWNGVVIHEPIRIVLGLLLGGAVLDLAKTAFRRLYGKRPQG